MVFIGRPRVAYAVHFNLSASVWKQNVAGCQAGPPNLYLLRRLIQQTHFPTAVCFYNEARLRTLTTC